METNKTIELVGYGHPDRFADYIAEKILTECLKQDKKSKVAIEVLATKNSISLGGELTTKAEIDFEKLVYGAIEKIYGEKWWPNYRDVNVYNHIEEQSPELAKNQENEIVAGDQGVVYGYYDEGRFEIIKALQELMRTLMVSFDIAPDWKLLYNAEKKELSMSVCGDVNHGDIKGFIEEELKYYDGHITTDTYYDNAIETIIINPKGKWLIPGPLADTGVVGRKLMIDTFGAGIPHGGGAFCGKDPSKVDKTGVIIASKLAKEIAQEWNEDYPPKVLVELNYKIGDKLPKAYAYVGDHSIMDVTDKIKLTLNEFIKEHKLLENKYWSAYVMDGGVLAYLGEI